MRARGEHTYLVDELAAYERRFRKAGLPLLIEDYSATEDVFTRAFPLLAFLFVISLLGAVNLDWGTLANVGAVAGGMALMVAGVGALNRARGRPFFSIPRRVGVPELAVWVLLPALLPLVFGGQLGSAAATVGGNLLTLGLIYVVVALGLISILRWTSMRMFGQLATSLVLLTRAIPLLLFFSLVLFLTEEMWRLFSSMPDPFLALVGALFVGVGGAFLLFRLPREVRRLEEDADAGQALRRRQRFNVGLVMFVSQALQVLVVSVGVGAFFVLFGVLAVGPELQTQWTQEPVNVLMTVDIFGETARLTEEILRVAGGIAAFTGLYYAIAVLTEETYRQEFLTELTGEMRETFRARSDYLRLRESG